MINLLSATAGEVFKYIGFIIVAILALMLMIIIHESGHYLAGKLLGFRIDEFSIGFGPAIFKRRNKKNGEIFSIRPIPIGGFCAFHGEDQEGEQDNPYVNKEVANNGKKGILSYIVDGIEPLEKQAVKVPANVNSAVATNGKNGILSYIDKPAKGPYFNDHPAWKRLIVLFSGAFFNFLSSIFIITIYFTAYGQILPVVVDTYDMYGFEQQFMEGDVILSVNGKQVNIMTPEDVNAVFSDLDDTATFKVLRMDKVHEFTASRGQYHYETVEKDDQGNETHISETRTGYGISYSITQKKLNFFLALGRSFGFAFFIVFKILASLGALITGKIGIESAGGTITVVKTIAEVSSQGFGSFMYVVAIISANLAVMNLLPIPALDGSRMAFTGVEMIFRKPIPRKIEGIIHTIGLVLMLVLVVFLDVFHLVNG